jgi:hypothetical protein
VKSIGYLVLQRESVWAEQNVCRGNGGKAKTLSGRSEEERGKYVYKVVRYDMKEGVGNNICKKKIKRQVRNKRKQNSTSTALCNWGG